MFASVRRIAAPSIVYLCAGVRGESRLLKELCQAAAAASVFERADALAISECVVLDDPRGGAL